MANLSLKEGLELYRSRVSILKKGYSQERFRVEQLARSPLGEKIVREITSVDIATYRDERLTNINPRTKKPMATSSVRLEMSLLSSFFEIARIEWGLCDDNPVKKVRKPKPPPGRDRRLSPREDRQILRYAHNHPNQSLYTIIVLALETAMRQSEILNLDWSNVNLKVGIAHLPETKNGSKRDVPLSTRARETLIKYGIKSSGKVFGYTSDGFKSTWRYMTIKLGIKDLHFHDLRHEAITRLFELGTLDIMEIAAISGHKSLAMLKRYTHLRTQRLVRKLEGTKHRGKLTVLNNMIPYPATLDRSDAGYKVRLLDFDELEAFGTTEERAIRSAQDTLMRAILNAMRAQAVIPPPDQYLELVDESRIVMIDPLQLEHGV
ncbi:site-specific integrase [Duganella sp. LjRoot269]|uniref:site-specific integrase n=1 Tax=Duganella sp. LjRoot269 TaxID=3342305 RepID=UPI003ED14C27